ncbi:uncharacterized protein AC631_02288 [Debaryomyces fabryi]|uniref:Impact N-terminal domain-containing protein n=1 Tax=Debaryomyces fabryi TaxID=58627 RepID=A0A0V1Q0K0_9ASCO|nr:uncharacterized protein AC631_02288 [Debaryomyces fabryi]KSA01916.1 hypothetical protein AC631_02288 [Debaryomyces fabryi]CUM48522.1 unnamed protein product [Debaryomyces fabryi]
MIHSTRAAANTVCSKLRMSVLLNFVSVRYRTRITEWYASEVITDRKSKFQARHVPITDEQEIPVILEQLLQDHKNISRSSHPHIIAWRTGQISQVLPPPTHPKSKKRKEPLTDHETGKEVKYHNISQGFKDNGEKGAGSKLLQQVLVHHNLINILVIVTRWYGGSPLGSLRFRHIINASLDSLRKSGTL